MNLNLKNPLAFFDIESTGLDVVNDRIVEIAVVKLLQNGERQTFYKKINPEMPIPLAASLIHGIYDGDVVDCPKFREVAKDVLNFLRGADISGFNVLKFDIPILVESFLRENMDFNLENKKIIDSQKIFHLMEKRNLRAAYKFYCKKDLENAHSALADTEASIEVLVAQVQQYLNQEVLGQDNKVIGRIQNDMKSLHDLSDLPPIDYSYRLVYDDSRVPVFNFGKYKGKSVVETLKKDPGYYNWIMQGQFPMDTKRKLTNIKLGKL